MKQRSMLIPLLSLVYPLLISIGCTDSPFGSDILPEPNVISGTVELLNEREDFSNVYVWLGGLNLGAKTDSAGHFQIEIPRELGGTGGAALNGVYPLYFYIANYKLNTAMVAVRDGKFVYGREALDARGRLKEVVRMNKILNVSTIVDPPTVPITTTGPIDVQLTLQAVLDSVTVIFPKSVGGLLGGMFFENTATHEIFIDIPDEGADTREYVRIGQEPRSRRQIFQLNGTNFRDLFLPVGSYKVIPFFFVDQDNLPEGLLESLGTGVSVAPTKAYLNIPFRREGGDFRVTN